MRHMLSMTVIAIGLANSVAAQDADSIGTEEASVEERTVSMGGIVDMVYHNGDDPSLNQNTLGDNNFNRVRSLLNFRFEQPDRLNADIEVLFDDQSRDKVRLQGAFVTILNLPDDRLNIMIGKIPNLFGTFARREFSDVNPLVGQPLVRQYRTTLDWNNLWDNREQLIRKYRRLSDAGQLPIDAVKAATPTVYDARWDFGIEVFGNLSVLDYQLAVTEGSISNPEADLNKGKQFLGRLGFHAWPGFKFGVSGAINPYLSAADHQRLLEAGKGKGEFFQKAVGVDIEASYRYVMLFSELVSSTWDATVVEKKLKNWSWYADVKVKLHPRWYVAGRYDMMRFSKIQNPDTERKEGWDYDITRTEVGVGFRLTSDATAKLVEQITVFEKLSGLKKLYTTAVQLSVPF